MDYEPGHFYINLPQVRANLSLTAEKARA